MRDATGLITNYHLSSPNDEWYETQESDEVILFKDRDGNRRMINDWVIFANSTNLLVRIVVTDSAGDFGSESISYESDTIAINAGDSWANGKIRADGIKVLGTAGQEIKYIGNYY